MKRKIGQFIATDENGRRYTNLIFTNIIKAGTFENRNKEVEGIGELKTFEGMAVNRLEKGKYQIVPTGIIVSLIHPMLLNPWRYMLILSTRMGNSSWPKVTTYFLF